MDYIIYLEDLYLNREGLLLIKQLKNKTTIIANRYQTSFIIGQHEG